MAVQPSSTSLILAFDVGATSVKAAVLDANLAVLTESRRPSRRGPGIIEVIGEIGDELLDTVKGVDRTRVIAAGVVVPGLIDKASGVSLRAVNLDLVDCPIGEPLARRWGIPVQVGHDVEAAGEAVRRSDGTHEDPFVVVLGTGIASVMFVGGAPVRGVSGQAGELGHMVVRPGGRVCRCGARGCLEGIAGAHAIVRAYRDGTGHQVEGARAVVQRVETDPVAAAVWQGAIDALADALVSVCTLTAPGSIILAGGLSDAGDALVGPLRTAMTERSYVATVPPILISPLGSRAGMFGAGHLALDLAARLPAEITSPMVELGLRR